MDEKHEIPTAAEVKAAKPRKKRKPAGNSALKTPEAAVAKADDVNPDEPAKFFRKVSLTQELVDLLEALKLKTGLNQSEVVSAALVALARSLHSSDEEEQLARALECVPSQLDRIEAKLDDVVAALWDAREDGSPEKKGKKKAKRKKK